MSILNDSFITQVYTSYLDLASFSRRVSAREPCGQFWDENEKLCWALASILLGSRCPEKHSIESKPIGVDCATRIEIFWKCPFHPFCSRCFMCPLFTRRAPLRWVSSHSNSDHTLERTESLSHLRMFVAERLSPSPSIRPTERNARKPSWKSGYIFCVKVKALPVV